MISPCWSFFRLSYEFELRKEASRLCKEQSFGIQAVLWSTLRNHEHRMKHWLHLVAIPNAPSSSSSQEIQALRKRISDLEKARSRSPRRNAQRQNAMVLLSSPSRLLPHPLRDPKEGKDATFDAETKTMAKLVRLRLSSPMVPKKFEQIMKLPVEFRNNFHERFHKKEICFAFKKKTCRRTPCKWAHICIGCGGSQPYDDCRCLSSKIH